jgi:hypothetical protein
VEKPVLLKAEESEASQVGRQEQIGDLDCAVTPHQEPVAQGQTVNEYYYCTVLHRLWEEVHRKRPERWPNQNWLLHHDNAPAHTALSVQQCLSATNMAVHTVLLTRLTEPLVISSCFPE